MFNKNVQVVIVKFLVQTSGLSNVGSSCLPSGGMLQMVCVVIAVILCVQSH